MPYDWKTELSDIYARHADYCTRREGGICICGPIGYRAAFTSPSSGRRTVSPDFPDIASAQAWLHDQQSTSGNGRPQAQEPPPTDVQPRPPGEAPVDVSTAIEEFVGAAE